MTMVMQPPVAQEMLDHLLERFRQIAEKPIPIHNRINRWEEQRIELLNNGEPVCCQLGYDRLLHQGHAHFAPTWDDLYRYSSIGRRYGHVVFEWIRGANRFSLRYVRDTDESAWRPQRKRKRRKRP